MWWAILDIDTPAQIKLSNDATALTSSLQPHERLLAKINQLKHSWIPDPQKIENMNICWFRLLNFGVIGYKAI